MTNTTQLNLRIPTEVKETAQNKAKKMWTNLNFLVKLFLSKFISENDIVEIKQSIKMEKLFDKGLTEYFSSKESIKKTQQINEWIEKIIENEDQYFA